jgi:hypothetical protein
MAPFLADIDASPRDFVDTTFNISTPEEPSGSGRRGRDIKERPSLAIRG